MEILAKIAMCITLLFSTSETMGSDSSLQVSIALSDGAIFGDARVEHWASKIPNLINGRVIVDGEVSATITFENIPHPYAKYLASGPSSVLYRESSSGLKLVVYPRPAVIPGRSPYDQFNDLKSTIAIKSAAFRKKIHCTPEMAGVVAALDSLEQQHAIDQLFATALDRRDLACLISSITSASPLKVDHFVPPFKFSDGVYYHGLPTRGDLVAFLLGHLTKANIHPEGFPMSDSERERVISAWVAWFGDETDGAPVR